MMSIGAGGWTFGVRARRVTSTVAAAAGFAVPQVEVSCVGPNCLVVDGLVAGIVRQYRRLVRCRSPRLRRRWSATLGRRLTTAVLVRRDDVATRCLSTTMSATTTLNGRRCLRVWRPPTRARWKIWRGRLMQRPRLRTFVGGFDWAEVRCCGHGPLVAGLPAVDGANSVARCVLAIPPSRSRSCRRRFPSLGATVALVTRPATFHPDRWLSDSAGVCGPTSVAAVMA
jgi:hypothetical protein